MNRKCISALFHVNSKGNSQRPVAYVAMLHNHITKIIVTAPKSLELKTKQPWGYRKYIQGL